MPMTIDHIQPVSKGGLNTLENLCLACRTCNEYKSDTTEAINPLTGEIGNYSGLKFNNISQEVIKEEVGFEE